MQLYPSNLYVFVEFENLSYNNLPVQYQSQYGYSFRAQREPQAQVFTFDNFAEGLKTQAKNLGSTMFQLLCYKCFQTKQVDSHVVKDLLKEKGFVKDEIQYLDWKKLQQKDKLIKEANLIFERYSEEFIVKDIKCEDAEADLKLNREWFFGTVQKLNEQLLRVADQNLQQFYVEFILKCKTILSQSQMIEQQIIQAQLKVEEDLKEMIQDKKMTAESIKEMFKTNIHRLNIDQKKDIIKDSEAQLTKKRDNKDKEQQANLFLISLQNFQFIFIYYNKQNLFAKVEGS